MNSITSIIPVFALVCASATASVIDGCANPLSRVEAASGYELQQMQCVTTYSTKSEIDRCRAKVKLAWSYVDASATDAAISVLLDAGDASNFALVLVRDAEVTVFFPLDSGKVPDSGSDSDSDSGSDSGEGGAK